MVYRKIVIVSCLFNFDKEDKMLRDEFGEITNVNFTNNNINDIFNHLNDETHENYENIKLFMLCLSLCHSVFTKEIEKEKDKSIQYQASSPDELSLVSAARYFGFTFVKREISNEIILKIKNQTFHYSITHILEYTSERKRMSVIIKSPEGKIYLLCKGADSIVAKLVTKNPSMLKTTEDYITAFANSGLRTLMVAYKELDVKEYLEFDIKYEEEFNNDCKNIDHLYDSIEKGLFVLGSTGIEDLLQDNVGETLFNFIDIGIKIWVLTGDKVGTAISIAHSCNLLTKDFEILQFKEEISERELDTILNNHIDKVSMKNGTKLYGLVVCSNELTKILANKRLAKLVTYIYIILVLYLVIKL